MTAGELTAPAPPAGHAAAIPARHPELAPGGERLQSIEALRGIAALGVVPFLAFERPFLSRNRPGAG
jgi:hypothetical protein